jgi:hypothetical protein
MGIDYNTKETQQYRGKKNERGNIKKISNENRMKRGRGKRNKPGKEWKGK